MRLTSYSTIYGHGIEVKDTILLFLEALNDSFEKEKLLKAIDDSKIIEYSSKKANATAIATKARRNKAKEKIQNAINILKIKR